MIDFTLSHAQQEVRSNAANFAAAYLAPARASYEKLPPEQRFQSTRPIVEKAATLGLLRSQIPPHLGGTGGSLIDVCLVVEEMYAVEPSVSLTLLSNALGLAALIAGGTKEQQEELLKPFLSGQGAPLAALVYSEPGGSANFFEEGGRGMATTARIEGDDWVVNGEKVSLGTHHASCNRRIYKSDGKTSRYGLRIVLAGTGGAQTCNASSAEMFPKIDKACRNLP